MSNKLSEILKNNSALYSSGSPQIIPGASLSDPKCPIISPSENDNSKNLVCPVRPPSKNSKPKENVTLWDRTRFALCKGGFASIITTMITGVIWHPVVTVMVRQQFAGAVDGAKQYRGVRHAFSSIYKEGVRAFYRGLGPRLMQSPLAAIQWTTYEMFRDVVSHRQNSRWDAAKYAALFIGSRALVTTVKCPFEIVKERMQVEGSLKGIEKSKSAFHNFRVMFARDGFRGLFHGLNINIMRDLPVAMLMMSGNDFYTHLITAKTPSGFWENYFRNDRKMRAKGEVRKPYVDMSAGALSGFTAAILTQPIDVAKTIMQTQSMSRLLPNAPPPKYTGMMDCLTKLRKEKGFKFWYTGFTTRAAHIMLGGSVYLMVYRRLQRALTTGLMPQKSL